MLRDRLYGEEPEKTEDFRFHCETLFSRSSLYRFEIGVHQHPGFFQILYISDGNGDANLDGVTQIIQPPAAILVPPGFEHGFLFSRDIAGVILTLLPGALSPSVQAVLRRNFHRPSLLMLKNSLERQEVETSFERIAQEYVTHEVGRDAMIEGHIAMIITLLARADRPKMSANSKNLDDSRFGLLQSLITRHFREPQDAQFYAGKLGLSQTHLNRLVRSACGLSLQRLIAGRQIEEAKQELLFTFSTVQNISDRLGFTEPGYFCRFFKRETGMTPRQWRMAERKRYAAF
ncbi:helix-turn-helix domain-containing protein (plasmid) [Rhizobium sp. 32-5/1]|uniref:helix-turn-helix domain-containing protein n=1 Tax=Rhizobium sp. 32-5/1 TaxID=3019602 RepID=UPI00240E3F55|nr:helix-turn-helix domain-containing protein [Rhizobium sp. 32-5/1]WEZ85640.1 helix-turn-helix domain-containing protein [Rhizobium sp. 32-5/1]